VATLGWTLPWYRRLHVIVERKLVRLRKVRAQRWKAGKKWKKFSPVVATRTAKLSKPMLKKVMRLLFGRFGLSAEVAARFLCPNNKRVGLICPIDIRILSEEQSFAFYNPQSGPKQHVFSSSPKQKGRHWWTLDLLKIFRHRARSKRRVKRDV